MPDFINNIKKSFISMRSIMHKMFANVTKKASSVFKVAGATVGTAMAVIMMVTLFGFIILVSIPVIVYSDITNGKEAEVININPEKN